MMIILLGLLCVGIYYLVKNRGSVNACSNTTADIQRPQTTAALDILEERYVNGEIDDVTFLKMKKNMIE